jgi:hypothetical protein
METNESSIAGEEIAARETLPMFSVAKFQVPSVSAEVRLPCGFSVIAINQRI